MSPSILDLGLPETDLRHGHSSALKLWGPMTLLFRSWLWGGPAPATAGSLTQRSPAVSYDSWVPGGFRAAQAPRLPPCPGTAPALCWLRELLRHDQSLDPRVPSAAAQTVATAPPAAGQERPGARICMFRDSTSLSPAAEGPDGSTVWMEAPRGHLGLVSGPPLCQVLAGHWV